MNNMGDNHVSTPLSSKERGEGVTLLDGKAMAL